MPPTMARPRVAPPKHIGGSLLVSAGVAVIVLTAVALLPGMQLPRFVRRVTVENPTEYGVEVDINNAQNDGWLTLGGFPPKSSRTVDLVIDQGRQWVFKFSHGGDDVGQIALSRAQLERANWRVTIPDELGRRLAAAGLTADARG